MRRLIFLFLSWAPIASTAAATVDFESEVLPLLRAHCFRCHGSQKQEGGLRLDRRQAVLRGGESGPALDPADPARSLLLERILTEDESLRMPQQSRKLNREEVALLQRWIRGGAVGLRDVDDSLEHWAFQPIKRPIPPAVSRSGSWPANPIDSFVAHQLQQQGLAPADRAERRVLIRRLYFDLLGLPPKPSELEKHLADASPGSYARLVDSLLAAPQFGERWGRHWLDLARYADSAGYEADLPRTIWRYRDWVIQSLNQDVPLNRFVIEQFGGDLLPEATTSSQLATGFHCNAMLDSGVRHESIFDRVNSTGAVFLGLTLECGQCHDHKTDPLSQEEYYRLFAFFNSSVIAPLDLSPEDIRQQRGKIESRIRELDSLLADRSAQIESHLDSLISARRGNKEGLTNGILALFDLPPGQRSKTDITQLVTFFRGEDSSYQELTSTRKKLSQELPATDTSLTLVEQPVKTHVFLRGDHTQPGQEVQPLTPAFLPPIEWNKDIQDAPDRADLGHWIVAPSNPLFARVTANRIWMRLLGRPLVSPENDFGIQTPRPRHHALLDYLAASLQESNSVKGFLRLVFLSETYKQSSDSRFQRGAAADLMLGQRRLRLEAELLRDNTLACSGLLVNQIGGPSVFPYQPEGILSFRATPATWVESLGADRYRRGMYTHIWRLTPHPMYMLFDGPELTTACTRRSRSNVTVQALGLLNDPTFVESAQALGRRMTLMAGGHGEKIRQLFLICLGRPPTDEEQEYVVELLLEQQRLFADDEKQAALAVGNEPTSAALLASQAAWVAVSRTMMNLDEFITRE